MNKHKEKKIKARKDKARMSRAKSEKKIIVTLSTAPKRRGRQDLAPRSQMKSGGKQAHQIEMARQKPTLLQA